MWWFRGSHANLLTAFRGYAGRLPSGPLLDAGCGTGGLLAKLARELPEGLPVGLYADAIACSIPRPTSARSARAGSAYAMPFAHDSLGPIVSAGLHSHRSVYTRR